MPFLLFSFWDFLLPIRIAAPKPPDVFLLKFCCFDRKGLLHGCLTKAYSYRQSKIQSALGPLYMRLARVSNMLLVLNKEWAPLEIVPIINVKEAAETKISNGANTEPTQRNLNGTRFGSNSSSRKKSQRKQLWIKLSRKRKQQQIFPKVMLHPNPNHHIKKNTLHIN